MNNINNDFEMHKKEIGLLDLDNYKESMKKIVNIGKKIYQDKLKVQKFIENLDKEEANVKDEKKKKGIKDTLNCAGGIFGSARFYCNRWGTCSYLFECIYYFWNSYGFKYCRLN